MLNHPKHYHPDFEDGILEIVVISFTNAYFCSQGDKIQLTNIRGIDRGMYRCVADNNVRPLATYDATVYVNFKPQARPIQSSYGQAQNRLFDLTIDCIVAG